MNEFNAAPASMTGIPRVRSLRIHAAMQPGAQRRKSPNGASLKIGGIFPRGDKSVIFDFRVRLLFRLCTVNVQRQ